MSLQIVYDVLRTTLDYFIIFSIIYFLVWLIRGNSKTKQIFNGVAIIVLMKVIATVFDLKMVNWLLDYVQIWGVLTVVIIFQPEIRNALEKVGAKTKFNLSQKKQINDYGAKELKKTLIHLANSKTGALITIEKDIALNEYIPSGTVIDATISSSLLETIFFPNTPLHDGAVIIRNGRVFAAGVFYPSSNRVVSKTQGARHRAAVAISEITDSVTFVVSEETGRISAAYHGKLTTLKEDDIIRFMHTNIITDKNTSSTKDSKSQNRIPNKKG